MVGPNDFLQLAAGERKGENRDSAWRKDGTEGATGGRAGVLGRETHIGDYGELAKKKIYDILGESGGRALMFHLEKQGGVTDERSLEAGLKEIFREGAGVLIGRIHAELDR